LKTVLKILVLVTSLSINAQSFQLGEKLFDISKVSGTEILEMPDAIMCIRHISSNNVATCLVSYLTEQVYIETSDIKNYPNDMYTKTINKFKEDFNIINAEIIKDNIEETTFETVFRDVVFVDNVSTERITEIKYNYLKKELKITSIIYYYNE